MSDMQQGPDWWQASDGRWYPPDAPTSAGPGSPRATPRPWWKRWWVVAIGVLIVLTAVGAATSDSEEPDVVAASSATTAQNTTTTGRTVAATVKPRSTTTTEQRPGSSDVYARIEAMTDCGDLQQQFDIAMDSAERRQPGDPLRTASLAYAESADERMKKLDCY